MTVRAKNAKFDLLHNAELQPCFIPMPLDVSHAQMTFKVIDFRGNRKRVHDFMWAVSSKFRSIFSRFRHFATT